MDLISGRGGGRGYYRREGGGIIGGREGVLSEGGSFALQKWFDLCLDGFFCQCSNGYTVLSH